MAVTHLHYVLAGHGLSNSKSGLVQVAEEIRRLLSSQGHDEHHALEMAMENVLEMQARLEVIGSQIRRAEGVGRDQSE